MMFYKRRDFWPTDNRKEYHQKYNEMYLTNKCKTVWDREYWNKSDLEYIAKMNNYEQKIWTT